MAKLTGKLGTWELPHLHMWEEREVLPRFEPSALVDRKTKIATIGSCFASELVRALKARDFSIGMHAGGLFYNTGSIRQEIERTFGGGWPERNDEPLWRLKDGSFVDPFNSYVKSYPQENALRDARAAIDREADALFKNADLIIMTLGLTETWYSRRTGNVFRQLPHADVYSDAMTEFRGMGFQENFDNLERSFKAIRASTKAQVLITVSPVPLHATFTEHDVRVANMISKSTLRTVAYEFCRAHAGQVHYFHSYEIVACADRQQDVMREDGRHVNERGVALIMNEFLRMYGTPEVRPDPSDTSWLTPRKSLGEKVGGLVKKISGR